MKNTEIPYKNLSKDYEKLYDLLKSWNIIISFIAMGVMNEIEREYSKITYLSYLKISKSFDFEVVSFFEGDFDKDEFIDTCEEYNIQYFDLD